MATFAQQVTAFYAHLVPPSGLPAGVQAINPYAHTLVQANITAFYKKYFSDTRPRVFILGINPGRFGSGTTGIPYTDPTALAEVCGIENDLPKRRELTSEFFYRVVTAYGGPERFYADFYPTAVSPIGFTSGGKNINYYDDSALLSATRSFIVAQLMTQLTFGARDTAVVLGTGKNEQEFSRLNDAHHFSAHIVALEHPRYIMQYKRKEVNDYVRKYCDTLSHVAHGHSHTT